MTPPSRLTREQALARHPPPAELEYLTSVIGAAALLALIEARGGTRVAIPVSVNQGSVLTRLVGVLAARALAAWRPRELLQVPLARHWRARIYRAEGLSYAQIARQMGITIQTVHRHLDIAGQTRPRQADLFDDAA